MRLSALVRVSTAIAAFPPAPQERREPGSPSYAPRARLRWLVD